MYLSTSTEDFPEMYLSTFQVLYKLYLSTDVLKGNSSVTHVTFVQLFYFHWATIKHLDGQSNKFKACDDLGVQLYITT